MSHTPGPWTYNAEGGVLNIRPKGTGWLLATIEEHWLSSQHHDIYANASLISAAPSMLQALKELFDATNHFNVDGKWFTDDDHNREILMNAEAAIAKAEGRLK